MKQKEKLNSEDTVYRRLKMAIRKRYIKQGSKLVEIVLAQQLGVSRTPVRSAIKKLEADGLVNSIPNRGAFVITPTRREIKETFLVRAQLEMMATRLATTKAKQSDITRLRELLAMESQVFDQSDLDDYYSVNDNLHLKIAELSGNRVLVGYIRDLLDRTRIYLILYDPFYKLEYTPTAEHQAIIDAIAAGDADQACSAVQIHINSSINGLDSAGQLPEDYLFI
ncbi:MAG: GntR family transcriptional regulator [Desulforhopalus sp.]|jgi:DNA-binding GntR family transcriptional regulator|nr:GntR family transcriptional regulator [Desulforhopalus sp.]